jgi:hypothetical protein
MKNTTKGSAILWIIIMIVVIAAIVGVVLMNRNNTVTPVDNSQAVTSETTQTPSTIPSSNQPAPLSLSGNACDYFPQSTVEAALGIHVEKYSSLHADSSCAYITQTGPGANLDINYGNASEFTAMDLVQPSSDLKGNIPGLGDRAMWLHQPTPAVSSGKELFPNSVIVLFLKGSKMFSVAVGSGSSIGANKTAAISLAKVVDQKTQ